MREYALVFVISAAVTFLVTPVARRLAVRVRAMSEVRDRDVHTIPTPRLGGIAMYAGVVAGVLVASQLPFLSAVARDYDEPRAVLVAGGLICLLGAIDDRWPLDALTKLAGQVACAGVMVLLGVQLSFALLPSGNTLSLTAETAIPLTIFVALVLVNAMNMVDGLDGLAAGVGAVAALAAFAYAYQLAVSNQIYRATPAALIAVVTAGTCVGFLPHNFYPARVFMGDSGSMLIGLLLAASMTSVTGEVSYGGVAGTSALPSLIPLAVPLAVLAVPFLDLLLAVVRRTRRGRSPFSPDKQHLHHRLLEIGNSHRKAVLFMWFWAALFGFGGVVASLSTGPVVLCVVAAVVVCSALLLIRQPQLVGFGGAAANGGRGRTSSGGRPGRMNVAPLAPWRRGTATGRRGTGAAAVTTTRQ